LALGTQLIYVAGKKTSSPVEKATSSLRVLHKLYFIMGMLFGGITPQ
jgi:hypothetical protein